MTNDQTYYTEAQLDILYRQLGMRRGKKNRTSAYKCQCCGRPGKDNSPVCSDCHPARFGLDRASTPDIAIKPKPLGWTQTGYGSTLPPGAKFKVVRAANLTEPSAIRTETGSEWTAQQSVCYTMPVPTRPPNREPKPTLLARFLAWLPIHPRGVQYRPAQPIRLVYSPLKPPVFDRAAQRT